MKQIRWWSAIATTIVLSLLVACNRKTTRQTQTQQEQPKDAGQVLDQQKNDIESKTNAELNDWDRRIDQLKDVSKHVKSKARKQEWKNAIADLDKKKATVKDRLSDVKSAGADTLQTAASNLEAAETDLKNTYDEVVAKLGHTVTPPLRPEPSGGR
jgi:chromosome segregation ATPase